MTKYKTGAEIANKVLASVTELVKDGASVLSICEKGDELLSEEVAKVYKGKKISKGTHLQENQFMFSMKLDWRDTMD